jgi:HlyD family secretion protein
VFAIWKRFFAFSSVLVALAMLGWGFVLIRKNTPKEKTTVVRFTPPTIPGSDADQDGSKNGETGRRNASITRYIGGVGIVEPASEAISIGSNVAGIVTEVLVRAGDQVKKGQRLFVIDDRTAQASVSVSRANLLAQQAKLRELQGQIAPTRARVDSTRASLEQAKAVAINSNQELARAQKIAGNGLSLEELELRKLNAVLSEARVLEAEARLREAQGNLDLLAGANNAPSMLVQQAAVEQAAANVAKVENDLTLQTVVAPRDATVLQVKVRAGEFAPAAVLPTPLITLGVTDPLHIRVDIDESEIPRFDSSTKAYGSVRGLPEMKVLLQYVRTEPYVIPKKTLNGSVSERVDTRVMQIIYSVSPMVINAVTGQQVDVYIEAKSQ